MERTSTTETGARASSSAVATGPVRAVSDALSRYATFEGRTSRGQYWWFALFAFAAVTIATVVDALAFGLSAGQEWPRYAWLVWLVLAVPSLAANVRRLHDTGRSGLWFLIVLVPFLGVFALIAMALQRGTRGPNRYGPPVD